MSEGRMKNTSFYFPSSVSFPFEIGLSRTSEHLRRAAVDMALFLWQLGNLSYSQKCAKPFNSESFRYANDRCLSDYSSLNRSRWQTWPHDLFNNSNALQPVPDVRGRVENSQKYAASRKPQCESSQSTFHDNDNTDTSSSSSSMTLELK